MPILKLKASKLPVSNFITIITIVSETRPTFNVSL